MVNIHLSGILCLLISISISYIYYILQDYVSTYAIFIETIHGISIRVASDLEKNHRD